MLRGVNKELFELIPLTDAQKALNACFKVQDADSFLRIADVLFSRLFNKHSQWKELLPVVKRGEMNAYAEWRKDYISQLKVGDRIHFDIWDGFFGPYDEIGEIIQIINPDIVGDIGYVVVSPISYEGQEEEVFFSNILIPDD